MLRFDAWLNVMMIGRGFFFFGELGFVKDIRIIEL